MDGGPGLAALAGTWVLGRLAMMGAGAIGPLAAMALDLLFPLALCAVISAMLLVTSNRRNFVFIALLAVIGLANLSWHLEMMDIWEDTTGPALNLLLIMIAVIGGRVIPMFSANWMQGQGRPLTIRHPVWL